MKPVIAEKLKEALVKKYEAVKAVLQAWFPKVKKGGHIAGHDYISDERVRRAVNEFFTSGSYDEEENCWYYYVK